MYKHRIILSGFALSLSGCLANNDTQESSDINAPATQGSSQDLARASLNRAPYDHETLLVKFRPGISSTQKTASHSRIGSWSRRRFFTGAELVRLPAGLTVAQALEQYRQDPSVQYAEPNYRIAKAETLPDDPSFASQWALSNAGQTVNQVAGLSGADTAATRAWDLHTGTEVVVAAIDTGIDYTHPDLSDNIWTNPGEIANDKKDNDGNGYVDDVRGWNFAANTSDPLDDDQDGGHGTHVAGIIGARGNNALGVSGMNWSVKLMPLKFLTADGFGDLSDALTAMDYAIRNGARVINASYTYPQSCMFVQPSQAERDMIAEAAKKGIIFVAAAGNFNCNNDKTPFYPASHALSNVISVAASDSKDQRASFSNYGQYSVHVAAPGKNIYSTLRGSEDAAGNSLVNYGFMSGTSMAAPMVTGLAALLASYHPDWTGLQIREAILRSVDTRDGLQDRVMSGGRINAYQALKTDLALIKPFQPSYLTLDVAKADQHIILSWVDNSTVESEYVVERRLGETGNFQEIARRAAGSTSYDDTEAKIGAGTGYCYRVKARNAQGDSPYTQELSKVTQLPAPTQLGAVALAANEIGLTWSGSAGPVENYILERNSGGQDFVEVARLPSTSTSYTDMGLAGNTSYNYRVSAYNGASGKSAYSNLASATTLQGTVDPVTQPEPDSGQVAPAGTSGGSGGCFIATAAYGSYLDPKVQSLRNFRDLYLESNAPGRAFVHTYYRLSPPIARFIAQHAGVRAAVRGLLSPVLLAVDYFIGDAQAMSSLTTHQQSQPVVQGELLLGFQDGTPDARAREIIATEGAVLTRHLSGPGIYVVRLRPGLTLEEGKRAFAHYPELRYAQENLKVRKAANTEKP